MIAEIIVLLVYGCLVVFLLNILYEGLKTGKIRYRDSTTYCDKKKHPLFYWMVVLIQFFFLVVASLVLYVFFR